MKKPSLLYAILGFLFWIGFFIGALLMHHYTKF